jgi:small redox-active disulfide protein 2
MDDDSTQIWVGEDKINIRGLKEAIEEVALSHADRTDGEIQDALLERLSEKNYIASCATKEYAQAFLREYRKSLGQPYEEESSTSLRIVVLGPGCAQCDRLEQTVKQALTEMGLPAFVEHVTDIKEIAKFGVATTPALMVNGKLVVTGTVPSVKKIKELIR